MICRGEEATDTYSPGSLIEGASELVDGVQEAGVIGGEAFVILAESVPAALDILNKGDMFVRSDLTRVRVQYEPAPIASNSDKDALPRQVAELAVMKRVVVRVASKDPGIVEARESPMEEFVGGAAAR